MSEPLHVGGPRSDLFQGQGRTIEVVNVMSQIQQQLSATQTTQGLLDAIVGVISELTEFHRCMVYQFDEAYNGTVVAELATPQASSDVYRGLHFPASDIPKQARDLYKINRVRTLFDRELEPSRLICRNVEDLATPVDLTHSYLRAISPVHLKYLGNMGVKSTMSISLDYRDDLWGLVVCHSYGPKGLRVPFPLRELCYWVGMCASNCLDKLLNAEKLRARNSLISMQIDVSPQLCISASSDDLLRLFQADFGFLVVKGEARTIGKLSSYPEAVTLLRYVYFRNFTTTYATKAVSKDFTDLVFEPGFIHIAGLLYIPLSHDAGDFIVFFRKNQVVEVHWAGNPNMAKIGALEPRNSFKKWTETVKKSSRPWTDEQCTFTIT
jgi:light-regulated signal transduction histidine kinase (bacteriophytochrome)